MNNDHTGHIDPASAAHVHPLAPPAAPISAGGVVTYSCPMHPEIRQSAPGKCSKCGMTLELQEESN